MNTDMCILTGFAGDHQVLIVKLGCLPQLYTVIKRSKGETLTAAVACLRNLSIHKANEVQQSLYFTTLYFKTTLDYKTA